jgi:hypothetical protein
VIRLPFWCITNGSERLRPERASTLKHRWTFTCSYHVVTTRTTSIFTCSTRSAAQNIPTLCNAPHQPYAVPAQQRGAGPRPVPYILIHPASPKMAHGNYATSSVTRFGIATAAVPMPLPLHVKGVAAPDPETKPVWYSTVWWGGGMLSW